MLDGYADYDGLALAELVRSGQLNAAEVVEAAIEASSGLDRELNFLSHELYDAGRAAAANPNVDAPFAGVPFLLKDLGAEQAGTPYEGGSRLLAGHVSPRDSNLTRRFRAAGLITIGKSTTPEFGAQITTESLHTGVTRNPWSPQHTPGGSSGGSAVAVAAGVVPIAHANDGLGSIRIPASNCGLFGLKPTRQRTPCGPDAAEIAGGRGVEFVVSRSVRDSAVLLDAVHGPDVGAPHCAPAPSRPYRDELGRRDEPLRIAVMAATFTGTRVHAECADAVADTANLCAELGHHVEFAVPSIDWEGYLQAIRTAATASMTHGLRAVATALGREPSPDTLEPLTWLTYIEGQKITAFEYLNALEGYGRLQRAMGAFFEDYDVLLTPVLSTPPAELGWLGDPPDDLDAFWLRFANDDYSPFAGVFNVTGQPAASIPLHRNSAGLPIGTQIVARFGDEGTIFRLAYELESARPWAAYRPPTRLASTASMTRSGV